MLIYGIGCPYITCTWLALLLSNFGQICLFPWYFDCWGSSIICHLCHKSVEACPSCTYLRFILCIHKPTNTSRSMFVTYFVITRTGNHIDRYDSHIPSQLVVNVRTRSTCNGISFISEPLIMSGLIQHTRRDNIKCVVLSNLIWNWNYIVPT